MTESKCRTDKGRALAAYAKKDGAEQAYIEFSDGKRYLIGPVWDIDTEKMLDTTGSPGCWFNKVIRRRPRYGFLRVHIWPVEPQPGWTFISWRPKQASGLDAHSPTGHNP